MDEAKRILMISITAAALASVLNTVGGVAFHSRLLVINGLTCIANLVVIISNAYFYRKELEPEDLDHPFGHAGYSLSASVLTLLVYAFILGLGVDEVLNPSRYSVAGMAWLVPLIVAGLYTVSVITVRRLGEQFVTYSNVTTSEIAESLVALAVLPLAHYVSFEIDRLGAAAMLIYLAYQVITNSKAILYKVTGPAPPRSVSEGLTKDISSMGVKVKDLKLRSVGDNYVAGYVIIEAPPTESVEAAHELADKIEIMALEKYNVKLVVHIEPERA
ncbi:Cation efflux protein CzrB [Acidilobus saccharovorans 345-15]|uniref:Cation efflux protein CzrB n=1 Tax=Acidilobus saccharovorans (strain DSM 16705 / JCM 18335 / VKM B-2471 / 345-15) TaxID=666510 RepID=D9Q2L0_ACIS3|nr:cation transporter dimerization domain-containing protein [Acidilobus saccharovorans]ADL19548.1 Cation efflux protein CzrB [Acidilobus saccharovorans 345-15]